MNKIKEMVSLSNIKKSRFDLTHDHKTTCKMGELVPICLIETLPGDRFDIGADVLTRLQPLVSPVMHRFDQRVEYFFVPNRLLWKGWRDFITMTEVNGAIPTMPTVQPNPNNRLSDHLGVQYFAGNFEVSALPYAAYQLIYSEYYRDQNLAPNEFEILEDGSQAMAWLDTLRNRAWEHDYFTSNLPFAQKGDPVTIPLLAEIKNNTGNLTLEWNDQNFGQNIVTSPANPINDEFDTTRLVVDENLSTINELRTAEALQSWLETNARAGTRYTEQIRAHFGVFSSDGRMQRPEYIHGVKSPVIVSEVLNTGDSQQPIGNMAGHGVGTIGGEYGHYECEEHGFIIGIYSIMPKSSYQQGTHRMWRRLEPLEFAQPEFSQLGEQEVYNYEIYNDLPNVQLQETFGYLPRYQEYKMMQSVTTGEFRNNLSHWTATRIFTSQPQLNELFIKCSESEFERIWAVQDGSDHILVQVLNKIEVTRCLPMFNIPRI